MQKQMQPVQVLDCEVINLLRSILPRWVWKSELYHTSQGAQGESVNIGRNKRVETSIDATMGFNNTKRVTAATNWIFLSVKANCTTQQFK